MERKKIRGQYFLRKRSMWLDPQMSSSLMVNPKNNAHTSTSVNPIGITGRIIDRNWMVAVMTANETQTPIAIQGDTQHNYYMESKEGINRNTMRTWEDTINLHWDTQMTMEEITRKRTWAIIWIGHLLFPYTVDGLQEWPSVLWRDCDWIDWLCLNWSPAMETRSGCMTMFFVHGSVLRIAAVAMHRTCGHLKHSVNS